LLILLLEVVSHGILSNVPIFGKFTDSEEVVLRIFSAILFPGYAFDGCKSGYKN
jgi:hypothetical protein